MDSNWLKYSRQVWVQCLEFPTLAPRTHTGSLQWGADEWRAGNYKEKLCTVFKTLSKHFVQFEIFCRGSSQITLLNTTEMQILPDLFCVHRFSQLLANSHTGYSFKRAGKERGLIPRDTDDLSANFGRRCNGILVTLATPSKTGNQRQNKMKTHF